MTEPVGPYRPYRGKRVFDLVILAGASIPVLIVGVVCAIAVRVTSKGPIFFRQIRVGMDGAEFSVWKFRTMVAGDNPIFPDATRITSAGKWLRRLSLDEMPQLINVATGEMSVVGPRPTLPYQVARYTDHQRQRLCVKPGITGLAQVSGRNALSWGARIEYDIDYVRTQSVALDIRIIVRTVLPLITGKGAEGHPTDDPLAATGDPVGPADPQADPPT